MIRKYLDFIKEELNFSTMTRARNKMKELGQTNRADNLDKLRGELSKMGTVRNAKRDTNVNMPLKVFGRITNHDTLIRGNGTMIVYPSGYATIPAQDTECNDLTISFFVSYNSNDPKDREGKTKVTDKPKSNYNVNLTQDVDINYPGIVEPKSEESNHADGVDDVTELFSITILSDGSIWKMQDKSSLYELEEGLNYARFTSRADAFKYKKYVLSDPKLWNRIKQGLEGCDDFASFTRIKKNVTQALDLNLMWG